MRKICALESTLLGGVATADGEVTPTSSLAAATPTSSSGVAPPASPWSTMMVTMLVGALALLF